MRTQPPRPGSISAKVLCELFTCPKLGLTAPDIASRLSHSVHSVRVTLARLLTKKIIGHHHPPQMNAGVLIMYFLTEAGRDYMARLDLEGLAEDDEDEEFPLHAVPNVAEVIRYVPNSVWALGTMRL